MSSELKYVPPTIAIDIGADPINRTANLDGYKTYINLENPANDTGILDIVKIWADTKLLNTYVGIFYHVSGNLYKSRANAFIASIEPGAERTKSGLSLAVEINDLIGLYWTAGDIEMDLSGFAGYVWDYGNGTFEGQQHNYTLVSGRAISLFGTGTPTP